MLSCDFNLFTILVYHSLSKSYKFDFIIFKEKKLSDTVAIFCVNFAAERNYDKIFDKRAQLCYNRSKKQEAGNLCRALTICFHSANLD